MNLPHPTPDSYISTENEIIHHIYFLESPVASRNRIIFDNKWLLS